MKKLKLLVVDDDAGFAKIIKNIAVGVGIEVIETDDSRKFSSLYSDDLDIVVLDVFMPEIDGIELLRFLSSKNSQASIVLMSGGDKGILHSVQELAIERKLTVLGALQKPFSVTDLEDMFAKHVSRPQPNASNLAATPTMADLQRAIERG
ncbi:response regulator [Marinomonas profundimaris]|uniref:response regulator n=1 Tax=Marinomonas profundimaris TaxID=1208321 RepID=UPI0004CFA2C5|nr:response regulator [Marinomonas profundimaris]